MESQTLRTDNSIIDFVIAHILSINYSGDSGLSLAKWPQNRSDCFMEIGINPPASIYDKVLKNQRGLSRVPNISKPCLYTTGMNIELLVKLLPALEDYDIPKCFINEIKTIALLQLEYCMETLKNINNAPLTTMASVLNAGLLFSDLFKSDTDMSDVYPSLRMNINELINQISSSFKKETSDTMEIASYIKTLTLRNKFYGYNGCDDVLTEMILEILSRRTHSGLFYHNPDTKKAVSLGQQFHIMENLLFTYPFVRLDAILDEVFDLFGSMYQAGYKEALGYFTFAGGRVIQYNAFDVGSVISCLNGILNYMSEESEQYALLDNILKCYIDFLIDSFNKHFDKDIARLYSSYQHIHITGNRNHGIKYSGCVVFPKRIGLSFPGPAVNWNRIGLVHLYQPLYLCSSLLSTIKVKGEVAHDNGADFNLGNGTDGEADGENDGAAGNGADGETVELMKLLFNLFSS